MRSGDSLLPEIDGHNAIGDRSSRGSRGAPICPKDCICLDSHGDCDLIPCATDRRREHSQWEVGTTRTVEPLKEADLLAATKVRAQAPVVPGHIYLVRVVDRQDATFERIAKLLVLDHQPGSSVTFRWELLK